MRTHPVALLLALSLHACSDSATEPDASLAEGVWIGTITGDAQEGTLEWILEDDDGIISGEGSLKTASATVVLALEGTYSAPNLSLTMHPEGFEDIVFAGTVSERSIKGRMTGAGLVNRTVTLGRQPETVPLVAADLGARWHRAGAPRGGGAEDQREGERDGQAVLHVPLRR